MDAAWQAGITHFDTADAYGGGRSEASIGHWIATRGVRPQLTTKTCNPMAAGADRGLAPGRIARQLRASLDRLGVDHVELYLAHDFDPDVPLAETFGAFERARAQGAVGAYGVSNFDAAQLTGRARRRRAAGHPEQPFAARPGGLRPGCSTSAPGSGVAYLAFGPLAGGWLTGKYRRGEPFPAGSRMTQRPGPYRGLVTGATYDALDRLRPWPAAVASPWPVSRSPGCSPTSGSPRS